MLSILISAFNEDITLLAENLHQQCQAEAIPFEIIFCDDHSDRLYFEINRSVNRFPGIHYHYLDKNSGRSRVRNILAGMAHYPYLLFMDGDSHVIRNDFIRRYLKETEPGTVVCGGRIYAPEKPANPSFYLHWKYGTRREQKPAETRNAKPHKSFMTNNFLCPAEIFGKIQFDESLAGYGHEDTLFGFQLMRNGIPVKHIDNPLEHTGLITAGEFLSKGRQAVNNLALLFSASGNDPELAKSIRLLRAYLLLKQLHISGLYAAFIKPFIPLMLKNLTGLHPSLIFYDLVRLYWLITNEPYVLTDTLNF